MNVHSDIPQPDEMGQPQRRTPRASFYEYNEGYYFITICTQHKVHYLGEIQGNTFLPTPLGQYVENKLQRLQNQYANIEIPLYVVMPNHLHLMVRITGADTDVGTRQSEPIGERGASAPTQMTNDNTADAPLANSNGHTADAPRNGETVALAGPYNGNTNDNTADAPRNGETVAMAGPYNGPYTRRVTVEARLDATKRHKNLPLMSLFVNQLKGSVSRFAHKKGIPFAWQGRYHDHVIRGVEDMNQIAQYIRCNVGRWGQDRYNSANKDLYPNDWK